MFEFSDPEDPDTKPAIQPDSKDDESKNEAFLKGCLPKHFTQLKQMLLMVTWSMLIFLFFYA